MSDTAPLAKAASEYLAAKLAAPPDVLLVLGSGHGLLGEALQGRREIPFSSIPGLPEAGVKGHAGRFVSGSLGGRNVLIQSGRYHFYEGHPSRVVVTSLRLAAELGTPVAILTNAAGGIGRRLCPGDLVLLDDQINVQWRSPLEGEVQGGEARFPDMSAPFDRTLAALAEATARELGIPLSRGIYGGVIGPNFETPAEVRMLAALGADLVGMSTVPEVITARALGMRVLGISLVTNRAAGLGTGPLGHQEVLDVAAVASGTLRRLLQGVIGRLPERGSTRASWDRASR